MHRILNHFVTTPTAPPTSRSGPGICLLSFPLVPFSASWARRAPFFLAAALSVALFSGSGTPLQAVPRHHTPNAKAAKATGVKATGAKAKSRVRRAKELAVEAAAVEAAVIEAAAAPAAVKDERVLLAQEQNNKPAAAPEEPEKQPQPIPVTPDKGPQPEPNQPADAPATPGTPAPPPAPVTPGDVPATPAAPETPGAPEETSPGALAEAEGRPIAQVRVVGNRVVPAETVLLQVAGTRPGAAYSSRQVDLDRAKIDALGFFASVQHQVTPNLEDPAKVDVTFIVVENRVVSGYRFEGNTLVKTEDLEKVLETKRGAVLNRNSINTDVEKIQGLYRDRGYAALVNDARQDENGTLVFALQEARVSRVDLTGLKKTRPGLVRRLIRTKKGDVFDQRKIQQDLNRIYDTGFFEDISLGRIDDDPEAPGSLIVPVVLKERRTGQLSLGVGFDNRSRVTGFVSLAESNFRGSGKRVSASIELGSRRTFEVGLGDPFVGKRNGSYDISVFDRVSFREPRSVRAVVGGSATNFNFEERRQGLRINFAQPLDLDRTRSLLFGLRNERARLFQTDGINTGVPVNLPANSSGRVFALSTGFLRDRRDLRLDPSRGGREQIIIEKGLKGLGGTTGFTKIDLDLRRYLPLIGPPKNATQGGQSAQPRLVLAGRFVLGRAFGQLPAFEQFFVGGPDTVRGYDVDEQFGDNQIFGNLELRYRISRQFQVVGFADAGTAFGGQFASSNSKTLFGVGFGIRVRTPIGPIRLDIGRGDRGIKTHFAIGPTF